MKTLLIEELFLVRHLQKFWGASGDFWQSCWDRFLNYAGLYSEMWTCRIQKIRNALGDWNFIKICGFASRKLFKIRSKREKGWKIKFIDHFQVIWPSRESTVVRTQEIFWFLTLWAPFKCKRRVKSSSRAYTPPSFHNFFNNQSTDGPPCSQPTF